MDAVSRLDEVAGADRLKAVRWHERAPWPGAPLAGAAADR